jgi:hypothetical protein
MLTVELHWGVQGRRGFAPVLPRVPLAAWSFIGELGGEVLFLGSGGLQTAETVSVKCILNGCWVTSFANVSNVRAIVRGW